MAYKSVHCFLIYNVVQLLDFHLEIIVKAFLRIRKYSSQIQEYWNIFFVI